jgi:uncharacterized membrane protein YvbJ
MEKNNEISNSENNIPEDTQTQAGVSQQSTKNSKQPPLESASLQPTDPNTIPSIKTPTEKKQLKRWPTIVISLFLITILIVVAYFVFKYYQSNQQQPQTTTQ